MADGRVLIATVVNLGESEPPKKGLYFGGNRPQPPESEHQWKVLCLDLEKGHTLWEQQVHAGSPETSIHLKNSFASETPATDGQFFYVYFGNVGVYCFDLAGNEVWSKRLEPHVTRYGWGTAASPVVHGNHVYVVNDNEEDSYLLALDKHTGEEVWAGESRREEQLVDAVHLGKRRPDGDRDARHRRGSFLRPRRQGTVDAARHIEHHDCHAVCQRRPAVSQLGLRTRPPEADLRDSLGSERRYHARE